MKTSLIHSSYDKQTGTSVVGLGSKYGIFWGKSTLLDEDKNFESELRGCTYAEMKAYIKVKKAALKEERAILKGMNNLYKSIMNYKDKDIVTVHYMNKQINIQSKKVNIIIFSVCFSGSLSQYLVTESILSTEYFVPLNRFLSKEK